MSKTYPTRPTAMERLISPYNAAAFESVARRYAGGPISSGFYTLLSIVLAIMMLAGACTLFAAAAKSLYLDAYGVEAPGRILDESFHTGKTRHHTRWKKLTYEFTDGSGDVIQGRLDRPLYELTGLPGGDRLTVRYWDRFPGVNSPRGVRSNAGIAGMLAVILSLGCLNFACLSRRLVRWRNGLAPNSPAS